MSLTSCVISGLLGRFFALNIDLKIRLLLHKGRQWKKSVKLLTEKKIHIKPQRGQGTAEFGDKSLWVHHYKQPLSHAVMCSSIRYFSCIKQLYVEIITKNSRFSALFWSPFFDVIPIVLGTWEVRTAPPNVVLAKVQLGHKIQQCEPVPKHTMFKNHCVNTFRQQILSPRRKAVP